MKKKVFWAILAKQAEKTLPLYLSCLLNQDYDKKSIILYIRTNDNSDQTEAILENFVREHGPKYHTILYDNTSVDSRLKEFHNHDWSAFRFQILGEIRDKSLKLAEEYGCDFYFVSDVDNFIVSNTLSNLVSLNLEIVAPMLVNAKSLESKAAGVGGGDLYSNFHCDYDEGGNYLHDSLYDKLITREYQGVHKVRLVHCTYLVRIDVIPKLDYLLNLNNYEYRNLSISAEQNGVSQYLDNRFPYGALTLVDDSSEAGKLLEKFEALSRPSNILYKILHAGSDENRKTNFHHLDRLFGKYFNRLSSKTEYLSSLDETRKYLKLNPDLKIRENSDYTRWLPGAIGIWASWKNAFNAFSQSEAKALILIEDDLWVREDFVGQAILIFIAELPDDWDYLTLYTPESQRKDYSERHDLGFGHISLPYHTWSTACIIFSQSGASKIVDQISQGVSRNSDLFLFTDPENHLNGYALKPSAMHESISVFTNWSSTVGVATENRGFLIKDIYDDQE